MRNIILNSLISSQSLEEVFKSAPFISHFKKASNYAKAEWNKLSLGSKFYLKISGNKKAFIKTKEQEYLDTQPKEQILIRKPQKYIPNV